MDLCRIDLAFFYLVTFRRDRSIEFTYVGMDGGVNVSMKWSFIRRTASREALRKLEESIYMCT